MERGRRWGRGGPCLSSGCRVCLPGVAGAQGQGLTLAGGGASLPARGTWALAPARDPGRWQPQPRGRLPPPPVTSLGQAQLMGTLGRAAVYFIIGCSRRLIIACVYYLSPRLDWKTRSGRGGCPRGRARGRGGQGKYLQEVKAAPPRARRPQRGRSGSHRSKGRNSERAEGQAQPRALRFPADRPGTPAPIPSPGCSTSRPARR